MTNIKQINVNNTTYDLVDKDSHKVAYATCTTAAATAAKIATVSNVTNWVLETGAEVVIKFSYTNTASNPTLNVNGSGAKSIVYTTSTITTSNLSYAAYANRYVRFVYNGSAWVWLGWSTDSNTTYSNIKLGQGYGTCDTDEATLEKAVVNTSYTSLVEGGIMVVKFSEAVPANSTLNINSMGAKSIYYQGAAIVDSIIGAGDTATFMYHSSIYYLLSVDKVATGQSVVVSESEPTNSDCIIWIEP
jgi:hypothetical protein